MGNIIRTLRKKACTISPVIANKVMYRILMKKKLNLDNPTTFNEKINWLKLYKYPEDELIVKCTDKFAVREFIKEKNMEHILNELYTEYNSELEIEWENLPDKFVLKCNHGCGYNIICSNKDKLDIEIESKKLRKWMNEDFGRVSGEPHYSKINRKIICEKYLGKDILDYKFFCFKGKPEFLYISRTVDGSHHGMEADFFDLDGNTMPFRRTDHKSFKEAPKMMRNMAEAIEICKVLSSEFEFVRVDLFEVGDKIYFSELTFSPCSGMMPFEPKEFDSTIGQMIAIRKV